MEKPDSGQQLETAADQVLGYLNFSSGARDPQFLANVDLLWASLIEEQAAADDLADESTASPPREGRSSKPTEDVSKSEPAGTGGDTQESTPHASWTLLSNYLRKRLDQLAETSSAFREPEQALATIDLAFDKTLHKYLAFHSDLLFHQRTTNWSTGSFWIGCRSGTPSRRTVGRNGSDRQRRHRSLERLHWLPSGPDAGIKTIRAIST